MTQKSVYRMLPTVYRPRRERFATRPGEAGPDACYSAADLIGGVARSTEQPQFSNEGNNHDDT